MMIPRPTSMTAAAGNFELDDTTRISSPRDLAAISAWLQSALRPATGLPLGDDSSGTIALALDDALAAEAFTLSVSEDRISVVGGDSAGVFYACQALLQLLPPQVYRRGLVRGVRWTIPAVQIEDGPRVAWRGVMLDVARHFMPKHDILRFIDLIAMHRLNVLHLHLTDDQGWRVEIRQYPRLTEIGGWRRGTQVGDGENAQLDHRPHGGYYTQDDLREIVEYAAQHFITVVPEIESPGHVQALLAAYPELGVTGEQLEVWTQWGINYNLLNVEESTVDFMRNVFDEVLELFSSTYIGVGGDECPKDQWIQDSRTQQRMAELGVADEEALQSWFIHQLDDYLTSRGRRLFGWDEILEGGLAPGATVASWRGMTGAIAAARSGHDVVSCPVDVTYFDYRQSDSPAEPIPTGIVVSLRDVYDFNPVPSELTAPEAKHVLGGQANIWTEHIDSPRTVDYFAFPRLCALAEALWSEEDRDFGDFERRLQKHLVRLDALGVEYRHAGGPVPWQQRPGIPGRPHTREELGGYIAEVVANIAG